MNTTTPAKPSPFWWITRRASSSSVVRLFSRQGLQHRVPRRRHDRRPAISRITIEILASEDQTHLISCPAAASSFRSLSSGKTLNAEHAIRHRELMRWHHQGQLAATDAKRATR